MQQKELQTEPPPCLEPTLGSVHGPQVEEAAPAKALPARAFPTRPPFSQKHCPEGQTSVVDMSISMRRLTPDPVSKTCDMKTLEPWALVTTTSRHGRMRSVALRVSTLTNDVSGELGYFMKRRSSATSLAMGTLSFSGADMDRED